MQYRYNGLEQRVSKIGPSSLVPTGASYYAYDEAGHLIGEYDANGVPRYETIYLGDTPVAVVTQTRSGSPAVVQTQLAFIYADHIDTPRVIARSGDHAIVWRWDLAEAFGDTPANDNPNGLGSFSFNQRFPGQVFDAETGLHHNGHRDYDAEIGRYVQFDPIGLAGGPNGYIYANQNPLTFIDPDGLQVAIPAPIIAPAAGSLVRPAAGTLIDPIVTPGAPDPNDPGNHQKCKSLKKRIDNLRDEIYNKRYPDLAANPGNLPQRIGPGEALRDTVRSHEKLLNRQLRRLRELEDQYDKECLC